MVRTMADENGVVMTLPTHRRDRDDQMGEQVRILNLEEIREDLASTVAEIRRRVSLGMVIGVVAGFIGILVAAVVAIATGDHGRDGGYGTR
jgi:hypothetical protein